jgi:hypothetical protein
MVKHALLALTFITRQTFSVPSYAEGTNVKVGSELPVKSAKVGSQRVFKVLTIDIQSKNQFWHVQSLC